VTFTMSPRIPNFDSEHLPRALSGDNGEMARLPIEISSEPGTGDAPSDAVQWLSDVKSSRVRWLWKNYIPAGKLSIGEGDPGVGKSLVVTDLAARISTGRPMPDGSNVLSGAENVLIVSAEDDLEDTIVPRLQVAGADLNRIATLPVQRGADGNLIPLTIPDGLEQLENSIAEARAVFVVIDPITCFLDPDVNTNNDASVRKALLPLAEVARATGAAIQVIRHLNKAVDLRAIYRGGGSIGFTAAARSVMLFGEYPGHPGSFVLASVKANLVARSEMPSLAYQIVTSDDDEDVAAVEWDDEPVDITAEQVSIRPDARRHAPKRSEAKTFLYMVMDAGKWYSAAELVDRAAGIGINARTLQRAAEDLGIELENERDSAGRITGWKWRRPEVVQDHSGTNSSWAWAYDGS
jgi:AAA domain